MNKEERLVSGICLEPVFFSAVNGHCFLIYEPTYDTLSV